MDEPRMTWDVADREERWEWVLHWIERVRQSMLASDLFPSADMLRRFIVKAVDSERWEDRWLVALYYGMQPNGYTAKWLGVDRDRIQGVDIDTLDEDDFAWLQYRAFKAGINNHAFQMWLPEDPDRA